MPLECDGVSPQSKVQSLKSESQVHSPPAGACAPCEERDDGAHKRSGLYVVDRSRTPTLDRFVAMRDEMAKASPEARKAMEAQLRGAAAQRIFVGSDNETAMVRLRDRAGRDRLRIVVAPDGAAKIEFLDEAGKVTQTIK